jgi:hypothetical protein
MGIFGWSYPPGCSGPPDDEAPCDVCGREVDDCICPECPTCSGVGDPKCYEQHGLVRTAEQIASRAECEAYAKAQAEAEAKWAEEEEKAMREETR